MYEHCTECAIYGDNYSYDEDGELVCICNECPLNIARMDGDWDDCDWGDWDD